LAGEGAQKRPAQAGAPSKVKSGRGGKGAGGRFVRRADKGKPFAQGLKATDPAGAQRAVAACGEAERLSREAQRQAVAAQRSQALIHAIEWTNSALKDLRDFHQRRDTDPPGPLDIRAEDVLMRVVNIALAQWEALLAEQSTSVMPGLDPGIHEAPPRAEIHHGSPGQARRCKKISAPQSQNHKPAPRAGRN
jgi:hypothetical protein